jgi:hypothetical protein
VVKWSKSHFEFLAKTINESIVEIQKKYPWDSTGFSRNIDFGWFVHKLMEEFSANNPRFDKEKFYSVSLYGIHPFKGIRNGRTTQ